MDPDRDSSRVVVLGFQVVPVGGPLIHLLLVIALIVLIYQTVSGKPINEAQLRAALKVDGKLAATIIDADPGDNAISSFSADTTTLVLTGKRKR